MEPREGRSAKNDQSLNVSSPLDVFEFNEEDELKSHNKNKEIKKRIFHSAFRQRRSVVTGKRVKAGRQAKKNLHRKVTSQEARQGKLHESNPIEVTILDKSPESDTIETDSSDSDSHQDGSTQVCNFVQAYQNRVFVEEEKEVTIGGMILPFLGRNHVTCAALFFKVNGIILKIDSADLEYNVMWMLHEIESFECCIYGEERPGGIIELSLGKSGAETLERKMKEHWIDNGHSFDALSKLRIQTDESLEEKIRQITSLSDDYKLLWKPAKQFVLDDWSDILFPKDDNDAVTVTKNDYLLLNPDEFISDTLIDFYIKYLQNDLPLRDKERFYFFNSFFFRKLEKIDENHQHGFDRLKRWTTGIDIFEKHYLFIPIMQSAHWSLAIICNQRCLSTVECDGPSCTKTTVILHFDSLEGSHRDIENPIRSYLLEAWNWNEKYTNLSKKISSIVFQTAKVPQQTNYSDCGLFLLHYVELFIKEVQQRDSLDFISSDWFDPVDASRKRKKIKLILKGLQENQSSSLLSV